ncbi:type II toxin-antitoxin system Phd/YefM family antitoxin [Fervidobacterium sp.]
MRIKQEFHSLAEAKAKFSQVVEEALSKDIIVTKNGKPVATVMSFEKYSKILDFIDRVWELYLLDLGDPSLFKDLKLEELFEFEDSENSKEREEREV